MRDKPARTKSAAKPGLQADRPAGRIGNNAYGDAETSPSQLQDDNRRLRHLQLEIAREQGIRRRAPEHHSRAPEVEVRNQPRRQPKD